MADVLLLIVVSVKNNSKKNPRVSTTDKEEKKQKEGEDSCSLINPRQENHFHGEFTLKTFYSSPGTLLYLPFGQVAFCLHPLS